MMTIKKIDVVKKIDAVMALLLRVFSVLVAIGGLPFVLFAETTNAVFPLPLSSYQDHNLTDFQSILLHRIAVEPFNLVVTAIFFGALIHIFASGAILKLSRYVKNVEARKYAAQNPENKQSTPPTSVKVATLHLLGEVEVIFAFWAIFLGAAFSYYLDWQAFVNYLEQRVNFTEPIFVAVIMVVCSTRPITYISEKVLFYFALALSKIIRTSSGAFWLVTLSLGSLLGSFITEPASITICAYMLSYHFFPYTDNLKLKYTTFAILLLNISLGGSLTHFAAPPVFLVAETWGLTTAYMFSNIGIRSMTIILIATSVGLILFYKEFRTIDKLKPKSAKPHVAPVPLWIVAVHLVMIAWTVANLHHLVLFVGSFFFFLGFMMTTQNYQNKLDLRNPLLIGLFLAGLVIHGGLQSWWLEPFLQDVTAGEIFLVSTLLTSFNDNAAITYLSSLLPDFPVALRYAVLTGALAGGGLTIIANAPNPSAFSILSKYFPGSSINHLTLLLYALLPLVLALTIFWFL